VTKYLFLFTIGSVQSFIAQARKTQDFYAGSFLLSALIDCTMKKLSNTVNGCEFIFPGKNVQSKPNRFIAEIESDDIEKIGNELKDFVKNEFAKIGPTILSRLHLGTYVDFNLQITDFLQVYWFALLSDEKNYTDTYNELETYLGAVKNVRDFQQLKETGRKCSLCGERNVLIFYSSDEDADKIHKKTGLKKRFIDPDAVNLYNRISMKYMTDGEGLCAICFTKRFADTYFEKEYESDYPSTAEIAAMCWLENVPENDKKDYKTLFKNFNEQLYFDENLNDKYLKKYDLSKNEESLSEAKNTLNNFYNSYGIPSKYYALIMLDGDNMGMWLSGDFLKDKDKTNLRKFHEAMSEKLGKYANEVSKIIKEPCGKLVYAGGDDALAFVNLEHLLYVLYDLRREFPKFEELGFDIENNHNSSASAGIVIAHYKTPLSEVLKWARKMEKEAKENGKRDAFAIAVLKHSGEINKSVWKWKYNTVNPLEVMKEIQEMISKDELSNKFIKNLNIEFLRLMDENGKWNEKKPIKTEIERLTIRSCQKKKDETENDFEKRKNEIKKSLVQELNQLFYESKSLNNFLSFLNIADFLAREER
jgi:CRISPR-associated protein Cmr2